MARADRPTSLEPERRLARRIVADHSLTIPVDIKGLLQVRADIEEIDFPIDMASDAAVDLKRPRPMVFINTRRPSIRQRFTLAHELAHICIAWHTGGAVCNPLPRLATPGVTGPEGEANTFASEVLLPRDELDCYTAVPERLAVAVTAQVSDTAMVWGVADSLPAGHVVVLCKTNIVEAVFVSPGTDTPAPYRGELFTASNLRTYLRLAADGGTVATRHGRSVHWWSISAPAPPDRRYERSKDLLNEILADVATVEGNDLLAHYRSSIGGVVGAANGLTKAAEADELVSIFHQRFVGKVELATIVDHPLFTAFLWAQADEMARRKRLGITRRSQRVIKP